MKSTITRFFFFAMGVSATVGISSCVDNDYDLSKDIDMTVQIGSEGFTFPASNTDECTLSQILDLEETSSIKAVADGQYGLNAGDYVLLQSGSADPAEVEIQTVSLDEIGGTSSITQLDEFRGTGTADVTVAANAVPTTIRLNDDNVTPELVSLKSADMSVGINVSLNFRSDDFHGAAIINSGYEACFDPSWTLRIDDPATASFLRMKSDNIAEFTKDMPVSAGGILNVRLTLVHVDFSKTQGQGLIAPGKFRLECDVITNGNVSIAASDLPLGQTANLELVTNTTPADAVLLAITGVVNPEIKVDPTSIKIEDIPDFLSDEGNVLDIENPRISFSVYNSSPVRLNLNATLTAVDENGASRMVGIGDAHGTKAVTIDADRTTDFVISRRPINMPGVENIVIEDLGDLIRTIPDHLDFADIDVKALPDEVTMVLGQKYTYDCNYEAIVPLAFGADMHLTYTHEELDWDEDLDKYNFNEVHVTADVSSTLPLEFIPAVKALDRQGNEINDVTATIEGRVAPGTIGSPVVSPLKIVLRSEAENIGRLDGVRIVFEGSTDAEHVGVNLNKAQALKFDNVIIKIVGGITVDLND